jgi:hypothetical protein
MFQNPHQSQEAYQKDKRIISLKTPFPAMTMHVKLKVA